MWQPQHIPQSSPFIQMNDGESIKTNIPQIYRTPIKRAPIIQNCELASPTPYKFDFNFYFGHLFSSGHLPIQQIEPFLNSSQPQKKENYIFLRSSIGKSDLKATPGSEYKIKPKTINSNENINIQNNIANYEEDSMKKNLNLMFDKAKNDRVEKTLPEKKSKIAAKVLFGSPAEKKSNNSLKKIFECSESTSFNTANKNFIKKKRFRKNEDQIKRLTVFYKENKEWSKKEIKKISEEIGLKENKVYKWLWDQKNKEIKNAKFYVDKKN